MESGNLNLLNPKNEKLKNENVLSEIWDDLLENYFIASSEKQHAIALKKSKQMAELKNSINSCQSCIILLMFYDPDNSTAKNVLNQFGLADKTEKEVSNAILRWKSKLALLEKQNKSLAKKENINFWKLVAQVESSLGYQINVEKTSLARWMAIVSEIKSKTSNTNKDGRRRT